MAATSPLDSIRTLIGAGKFDDAAQACRRLIDQGDDPEARYLLAVVMGQTGLFSEAIALFETAVREFPERADVAYNFGIILQTMGKLDEAMAQWARTIEIDPRYADAHFNLGRAYSEKRMWAKALVAYEAAATLRPENRDALYNLGNVNFRLGRKAHAKYCFDKAVGLDPGHVQGWINLGLAELRSGAADAAARALEKAIELDADNILAHFNLGQAMLAAGRWADGFREVEWRRRAQDLPFPVSGQEAWEGGDPAGRTILLYGEQGQGDVIQFLRYARPVAALGARVRVACHQGLVGIAGRADSVERAVSIADPPPVFDAYAPLMSLPHILGLTGPGDIPAAPYLSAPEAAPLGATGGLKVGLAWAGNPDHDDDVNRSARLADFRPLLEDDAIALFSLQVGEAAAEIGREDLGGRVADLGSGFADFTDTAAAIQALDLVISVDTAVAHLAGAIGKPVWLLLPQVPDWRWCTPGDRTPWYPTMRVFRQPGELDWSPVIAGVAEALAAFDAGSSGG